MTQDRRSAVWFGLIALGVLFALWWFLRDTEAGIPDWVYGLWN